jgi:predicted HTH transcriptional regulator
VRELFEQLQVEGEAGIDRLVSERTQETVELDFKMKRDAQHGAFHDDDKRNLGKALSAFANSAGGLLVWGIDARRRDGVDCAQALAPIAEIEKFRSTA